MSVFARWISPTRLECMTPASSLESGKVAVRVSLNGADYSESFEEFEYAVGLLMTSVYPDHGPFSGGTELVISGANFVHTAELVCRIGHIEVAASFVSSSEVRCTTPVLAVGIVDVAVSSNGQDFSSSVKFTSVANAMIIAASPTLGLTSGGTLVTVRGHGFSNSSGITCMFGGVAAPLTQFVSDTEIKCETPGHSQATVTVDLRSDSFESVNSGVTYRFVPEPFVASLSPISGPIEGGSIVNVRGYNFVDSSLLACVFGSKYAPARWVSSSEVSCVTPARDMEGVESVSVSERN